MKLLWVCFRGLLFLLVLTHLSLLCAHFFFFLICTIMTLNFFLEILWFLEFKCLLQRPSAFAFVKNQRALPILRTIYAESMMGYLASCKWWAFEMQTHIASLGMWFANKESIHILDRKAVGFGWIGHLAWNTHHFSSTIVISPDYKCDITMSCLTLNILGAKWYQFKLLIKSFCWVFLSV